MITITADPNDPADQRSRKFEGFHAAQDAYDRDFNPYLPHMPYPNPIRAACWFEGFDFGAKQLARQELQNQPDNPFNN